MEAGSQLPPHPSPPPRGGRERQRRTREFHSLTVTDVRRETEEAVSVAFEVPDALKETFGFVQGQYLTLRARVGGEELRRPYSVCVAPEDGELRVCVKKLHGGRFSSFVNDQLKVGDSLDVMAPMGRFHAPDEPGALRHYVGFAGGSGITPVMSNLRAVLGREPNSRFTLFYGNRNARSIIFRDELADLKDRFMGRLQVFHVLGDEVPEIALFGGLMDEAKVTELVTRLIDVETVDWFFICGPGPMMDGAAAALARLGVPEEKVKIESFGARPFASQLARPVEDSGEGADVEVRFGGITTKLRVPFAGQPILDAVHAAGIDAPYACKGGVCCSCRARLVEGEVDMDVVYGLEPDEIAAGFVLTCQSHPKTARVVIDYDG
jgi:ring-1,2-phenylacetyl-CoA epoxidase subunit PaaE